VNPRLNKFKKKNLIYSASLVVSLLFLSSLIPPLRTPLLDIFKLPLNLLNFTRHEIAGIIFYHQHMSQNEKLRRENDLLKQKLIALNEIYLENERLNKFLSLKQKSSYRVIAAKVIGRPTDSWFSVIIIGKGTYHGIKRGFVAINYLGLVGRVIETTFLTSKIMLINDPNLSVSAIVERSRQEGLVSGTLGSYLMMKYLPKEADVKISDVIVTSGLTYVYPKGLLIGTVVDINEEFSGLTRYCLIKPAVNLSSIEEVLIIIP
jgi:rod shape-determining protein MreC